MDCLNCNGYTMAVAMVPKFDIGYDIDQRIYILNIYVKTFVCLNNYIIPLEYADVILSKRIHF